MTIQAEISLYPLKTARLQPVLDRFLERLDQHDIEIVEGAMSSRVRGGTTDVFAALSDAFSAVAEDHSVVLILKASNACPAEPETS
jgi:uncharacterized protein YqgV (UPF0045/DUF77 family)